MILDQQGIDFLVKEEGGYILHPYKDSKGIPTISVGCTYYENGSPVTMSDPNITVLRAQQLFQHVVTGFEQRVTSLVKSKINQNQFNALVSIAYNIGLNGFAGSTLLKQVNQDPNSNLITTDFELWRRAGSDPTALLDRREREAKLYNS